MKPNPKPLRSPIWGVAIGLSLHVAMFAAIRLELFHSRDANRDLGVLSGLTLLAIAIAAVLGQRKVALGILGGAVLSWILLLAWFSHSLHGRTPIG
jgi:hypothetical protein